VHNTAKRAALEAFLVELKARFGSRILPVDEAVAERWGRMTAALAARGVALPAIDSLIAATALEHDLAIVTRNEEDFRRASIPVVNPFA
jgi:predicted nucleic acid-binding protein